MTNINILFLGASKRVSLIERFISSAQSMGVELNIYSCEAKNIFYPISQYAHIVVGPSFTSDSFGSWLTKIVQEYSIQIIIPNMDSATVALGLFREKSNIAKCWSVVSAYDLCVAMEDKILSQDFFKKRKLPIPGNSQGIFPKIAKPNHGFGAKGISIIQNDQEYQQYLNSNKPGNYLIQDLVKGRETTVDLYVSRKYGVIGYVLRDRLEVSDGEVMVCTTRKPEKIEKLLLDKISKISGWEGCITIQYFVQDNRIYLTEINPRFGGGATCGVEAGLDMPKYILQEYLGIPPSKPDSIKHILMTRARRDYFYEYKD